MRKLIILAPVLSLAFGLGVAAYAQGTIVFNNRDPSDGRVFIFTNGVEVALNQDLNFALLAGPPGGPLTLEHAWLLSDRSAKGINIGPGLFADPSDGVFVVPGVVPGAPANVRVLAWAGNYSSLQAAQLAGADEGLGLVFTMFTGSAAAPPASLVDMPQLDIVGIPEPRTWCLMAIGGIALAFLRGRPAKLNA
jgi:hypothetical protein